MSDHHYPYEMGNCIIEIRKNYRIRSSQGFMPVCFLNAVEKCEMEEYPNRADTSETLRPFSYNR